MVLTDHINSASSYNIRCDLKVTILVYSKNASLMFEYSWRDTVQILTQYSECSRSTDSLSAARVDFYNFPLAYLKLATRKVRKVPVISTVEVGTQDRSHAPKKSLLTHLQTYHVPDTS